MEDGVEAVRHLVEIVRGQGQAERVGQSAHAIRSEISHALVIPDRAPAGNGARATERAVRLSLSQNPFRRMHVRYVA